MCCTAARGIRSYAGVAQFYHVLACYVFKLL